MRSGIDDLMARKYSVQEQKYKDLIEKKEYKAALAMIATLLAEKENKDRLSLHYDKALCIFHLSKNESEPEFKKVISLSKKLYSGIKNSSLLDAVKLIKQVKPTIIDCIIHLAEISKDRGEVWVARNYYLTAMGELSEENGAVKNSDKYKIFEENEVSKIMTLLCKLEESSKEEWDNYINREYNDRKLIMPIDDDLIAGCVADGIDVFRMSNIPGCIKFPLGHPVSGQLYIGHPFKSELYVPYETYEETFFVDKVHELCDLLKCLGATDITIESVNGRSVSELYRDGFSVGAELDVKNFSGGGSYARSCSREKGETSNSRRAMHFKFDPVHKPYVPEGLVWYPESAEWQRLVQNRISGNMLEYSEYLSTVQTRMVNSTEEEKIKASAGILWAKANVNVEKSTSNSFKESAETEWKVNVTFRSIREMNKNTQSQGDKTAAPALPDKEQELKEKAKNTQSKGDKSAAPALSDKEQEYLETLKEIYAEYGEITDRDRKSLDKIRKMSGISDERAKELEGFLPKPSLTAEEKAYFESLKEIFAEYGEITDRDRKSLDKIRKMSGISEERAKEIEKMLKKQ